MTTTPEASAQTPAPAPLSPVRQKLLSAAARSGRTARARKATPRKVTTAPKSRNDRAAARGKYQNRIAPAIKAGATLYAYRDPVAARIIQLRADPFAASLDKVAAEDPRVDALLSRVSGWFGKGGAWSELGRESALMAGGIMLASGRAPSTGPAGMVLAMFAGAVVQQATKEVAASMAVDEMERRYGLDDETWPDGVHAEITAQIIAALEQQRAEKAARVVSPDADEDEPAPPADERPSTFAPWAA